MTNTLYIHYNETDAPLIVESEEKTIGEMLVEHYGCTFPEEFGSELHLFDYRDVKTTF